MVERAWWGRYVKPALNQKQKRFLANKVEDRFKSGAPDVDCMFDGVAAKIELKYVKTPVTPLRASRLLSAGQKIWLREWYEAGGLAFVLVGVEVPKVAYLFLAKDLVEAEAIPDSLRPLAVFAYGAKAEGWTLYDLPGYVRSYSRSIQDSAQDAIPDTV